MRSTPAISAPIAWAAASARRSASGVEPARLGTAAQRHVGAPFARVGVPAHHPDHLASQHEDAEVVARMPDRPLKIKDRAQAARAREKSARPAPCR